MPPPTPEPTPQCLKRLTTELKTLHTSPSPSSSLAALSPLSPSSLLHWRSILLGPPSTPYSSGRWLLSLTIPPTYPLAPPSIKFMTPCYHPNISFNSGEICLDLLNSGKGGDGGGGGGGWTPAYTLVKTLEAVQDLLRWPEMDSPLNVDAAVLMREDTVAAEGLCRFWCGERRWEGDGLEETRDGVDMGGERKGKGWSWW